MSATRILRLAGILSAILLCSMPTPTTAQSASVDPDGLVPREIRGLDSVTERPGVIWRDYDKVMISEVQVAFSQSWDPRAYGRFGLEPQRITKIRDDLGRLAQDAFAESLTRGGYSVVSAAGAGVLQVVPRIVDLYVNAPPRDDLAPLYTYVLESGEMTLVLELRDSVTGTLLGRVRDRYRDPGIGVFVLANEVTQQMENRRVLRAWAEHLRTMLKGAQDRPATAPATNPR